MLNNLDDLVHLDISHIKQAGETLAQCFQDDPLFSYLIPDAAERRRLLHHTFEFSINYGMRYGEAYATSENMEGVAVWIPSNRASKTLYRKILAGAVSVLFHLGIRATGRLDAYDKYALHLQNRHAPFPHWYLSPIGVSPDFQGMSYTSALMKPMLATLDQKNLPCYLETQNENNVPIYEHYGFKVVERTVIPQTEINHWAMLRQTP